MNYAVDLFCGAGGMSEGIIRAGFHILFSNDINDQVMKTYIHRHEQHGLIHGKNTYSYCGDIRNITGDFVCESISSLQDFKGQNFKNKIDVIFGGPPCQGFSRAGLRKGAADPRNFLFKEYVRVISELNPKYVVMENVEGFLDTKLEGFIGLSGKVYSNEECLAPQLLANELNQIGYNVHEPRLLNASDYGVPQNRRRVIFIAYRKDMPIPNYPTPTTLTNKITVLDAIGDLIRDKKLKKKLQLPTSQYQLDSINGRTGISSNGKILNNELSEHSPIICERFSLYNEGEKASELKKRIQKNGVNLKSKKALLEYLSGELSKTEEEVINIYRKKNLDKEYVDLLLTKKNMRTRLISNSQSLTVMTIADDYIHPIENRTFTVREMARLQSFDDSFEFLGKRTTGGLRRRVEVPQYSQVGNAVPPLLSYAIANEIMNALKKED